MKFFDYKFMIMLGLTMVVYFLYREIDMLNKRVAALENPHHAVEDTCDLPLPPKPETPTNKNKPVEMYSNDMIYSNDMMESDTNEQDTLMVESLVDLTNNNVINESDKSDKSSSEEENDVCEHSPILPKLTNSPVLTKSSNSPVSPKLIQSDKSDKSKLVKSGITILDDSQSVVTQPVDTSNMDYLLKNKLVELQEMATANGISLLLEGSTKKKTKLQLVQEIHNKKNSS